jgi:hypothetical protein
LYYLSKIDAKDEEREFFMRNNRNDSHVYALAVESVPGSALVSYLIFNTLFVLLGCVTFAHSGSLREFIEKSVPWVPEHSTKWVEIFQYIYI